MNFQRSFAVAGLVGLLALGGCEEKENPRRSRFRDIKQNIVKLNGVSNSGVSSPIPVLLDGTKYEVYVSMGFGGEMSYDKNGITINYSTSDTTVYNGTQKIEDKDIIESAEDLSERICLKILKNQREEIESRISMARSTFSSTPQSQPERE